MLPVIISDPETRQKVEDTFTSQEFLDNLEDYFVYNIKVSSSEESFAGINFLSNLKCWNLTFYPILL